MRTLLVDRRHLGHRRDALGAGNGDGDDAAVLDIRLGGERIGVGEGETAGDKFHHDRAGTLEGNVRQLQSVLVGEQLRDQMGGTADAIAAERQAGSGFCLRDQVMQVLHPRAGASD